MGLFHKNKQKEAVQEVKQPQISLEDKAYPIIYTANYISERFENLSDEEVVVSNQIVGIKEAFDSVLTEPGFATILVFSVIWFLLISHKP